MADYNTDALVDYYRSCYCGGFTYTIKLLKLETVFAIVVYAPRFGLPPTQNSIQIAESLPI